MFTVWTATKSCGNESAPFNISNSQKKEVQLKLANYLLIQQNNKVERHTYQVMQVHPHTWQATLSHLPLGFWNSNRTSKWSSLVDSCRLRDWFHSVILTAHDKRESLNSYSTRYFILQIFNSN